MGAVKNACWYSFVPSGNPLASRNTVPLLTQSCTFVMTSWSACRLLAIRIICGQVLIPVTSEARFTLHRWICHPRSLPSRSNLCFGLLRCEVSRGISACFYPFAVARRWLFYSSRPKPSTLVVCIYHHLQPLSFTLHPRNFPLWLAQHLHGEPCNT